MAKCNQLTPLPLKGLKYFRWKFKVLPERHGHMQWHWSSFPVALSQT